MSLSMRGHIDSVFKSTDAQRISRADGEYVEGIWVPKPETRSSYVVNAQPLNDKEIVALNIGNERVTATMKLYINSGDLGALTMNDDWFFNGQKWKVLRMDNRHPRNYCRLIVERYDDQN